LRVRSKQELANQGAPPQPDHDEIGFRLIGNANHVLGWRTSSRKFLYFVVDAFCRQFRVDSSEFLIVGENVDSTLARPPSLE